MFLLLLFFLTQGQAFQISNAIIEQCNRTITVDGLSAGWKGFPACLKGVSPGTCDDLSNDPCPFIEIFGADDDWLNIKAFWITADKTVMYMGVSTCALKTAYLNRGSNQTYLALCIDFHYASLPDTTIAPSGICSNLLDVDFILVWTHNTTESSPSFPNIIAKNCTAVNDITCFGSTAYDLTPSGGDVARRSPTVTTGVQSSTMYEWAISYATLGFTLASLQGTTATFDVIIADDANSLVDDMVTIDYPICDSCSIVNDCNSNGREDRCDILYYGTADCDVDNIPDDCTATCSNINYVNI
jgi:hypothetical protein